MLPSKGSKSQDIIDIKIEIITFCPSFRKKVRILILFSNSEMDKIPCVNFWLSRQSTYLERYWLSSLSNQIEFQCNEFHLSQHRKHIV